MKINNLEWQIKTTTDFDENLFGRTDYDTLTIYISVRTCIQTQRVSLLHELTHAFLHSYGFMFKDNFTREDICEFVAHNLDAICELYWNAKQELDKAKGH